MVKLVIVWQGKVLYGKVRYDMARLVIIWQGKV